MDPTLYRHRTDLAVGVQPSGWARMSLPGDPAGILLDPVLFKIWSEADGQPVSGIARTAQVSAYLASCALAVLERAGLLGGEAQAVSGDAGPSVSTPSLRTSVIVVHHKAEADLEGCLASVAGQQVLLQGDIQVVTPLLVDGDGQQATVTTCQESLLVQAAIEQLKQAAGEAILVLDSQAHLAPGSLAEMLYILDLRANIAAVAPRVMWNRWPAVVTQMADWRSQADSDPNPYAGQVDVGQFERRWVEAPAIGLEAALFKQDILRQVGLPEGLDGLDWVGINWSRQARLSGYRILAATQALACGPWPGQAALAQALSGQGPQGHERLRELEPSGPGAMLHEAMPALTVENVRGFYSHFPAIAPLPIRPQVAFLGQETSHRRAMARELAESCEVSWLEPHDDEEILRLQCKAADLLITTPELLQAIECLERLPRPVIVDPQPADERHNPTGGSFQNADALLRADDEEWLCAESDEPDAWTVPLAQFCQQPRFAPDRELRVFMEPNPVLPPPTPLLNLPVKAWQALSQGGLQAATRQVRMYVRWKVGM